MRVLGEKEVFEFCTNHADARGHLQAWLAEAKTAKWEHFSDIQRRFPSASYISGRKTVVFNIKQNRYRLEVEVHYEKELVIVKRLGTHAEYDRW